MPFDLWRAYDTKGLVIYVRFSGCPMLLKLTQNVLVYLTGGIGTIRFNPKKSVLLEDFSCKIYCFIQVFLILISKIKIVNLDTKYIERCASEIQTLDLFLDLAPC